MKRELTPAEQKIFDDTEKYQGRKLTEQEINLGLMQAFMFGELESPPMLL